MDTPPIFLNTTFVYISLMREKRVHWETANC